MISFSPRPVPDEIWLLRAIINWLITLNISCEEVGLNSADLALPRGAALSSFSAFAVGASIPLLPFFFASGATSLVIAIVLTLLALFGVGATLSLFTGRNAWLSGARMFAIGCAAGAVTFAIGKVR